MSIDSIYREVWKLVRRKTDQGDFDRFRVLCKGDTKGEREEEETNETRVYTKNIEELFINICTTILNKSRENNIWFITNYYSLFLKKRCKVISYKDSKMEKPSEVNLDNLSWYRLFATLNTDLEVLLIKKEMEIPIHLSMYTILYLNDLEPHSLMNQLKAILNNVNSDQKSLILEMLNKEKIKESSLCDKKFLNDWELQCLVYSIQYKDIDFSDTVGHYPNILFFKEKGEFTREDVVFCEEIKIMFANVSRHLLMFENEILLNRIQDLIDGKPTRIFEMFKDSNIKKHYSRSIENLFISFIDNQLEEIHPIIKNDLVLAYYLYRTRFFTDTSGTSDYLDIPPWTKLIKKEEKGGDIFYSRPDWFHRWEDEFKETIEEKKIGFSFKNFIFDPWGYKTPVIFERVDNDEFKRSISKLRHGAKEMGEFHHIVIGDIHQLENGAKLLYYDYVKKELERILNDMSVKKYYQKVKKLIDDGKKAAHYFSLFCTEELVNTGYRYIYYIPSVNFNGSSDGGFSFFCKSKWPRSITKSAQDWATRFGTTFAGIEGRKIVKSETKKHGTKSAVLSIDVRNLSHNIGSHVLAYWMQELNQLLQDIQDKRVNMEKLQTAINKSKALFRYIQHRADFLAEVATSIPCSEMSLNLKKDILNPFLNDKSDYSNPYNNHNNNTMGGLPLDSNVYVLLRYIAESEGITINFDELDKVKKMITSNLNNASQPFWVSIPSGLIGKHAIYSILENFIRNAAKHYTGGGNGENFIEIKVKAADSPYTDDYIKIEITDIRKNSCNQGIVEDLNGFLKGAFVDEQGRLKPGGWGIKEMLVSANFLRKNTPEDLYDIITNKINCNPSLLEIICEPSSSSPAAQPEALCKNCTHNNNLGIRFYLKKPKHLAVMVDGIEEEKIKKDVFEIKKIKADNFKDKLIPYNILITDEETYKLKYDKKDDPLVPCRVMPYDKPIDTEAKQIIDDESYIFYYNRFIDKIWQEKGKRPEIVNNIADEAYRFSNEEGLSIQDLDNESAKGNICFVGHPEEPASHATALNYFKYSAYFQPISGGFSTKSKFHDNSSLSEPIRRNFYLELIESALTKVVIVDERISKWADEKSKYFDGKPVREMLMKMKIYVAEIDKENISNLETKLSKEALGCSVLESENGAEDENDKYFFIIHQGILDKLPDKMFMKRINCRWKVIDSGRGVPEKMDYRFVQISALQTLLENYDKHGLVQTLFSLRKPEKEGRNEN